MKEMLQYFQNPKANKNFMKFSKFPFVGIEDSHYQYFMVELLRYLEPRFFKKKEIIYDELEEV